MKRSKLPSKLSGLDNLKWNVALKGIITGIVAGFLAAGYRFIIESGVEHAHTIYNYLRENTLMILPYLGILIVVALILNWFVKLEPMSSGSGIPQVEGLLLYGMKMKWYLILPIRFVAGFLSSLFGVSLGREGPSIQIGASSTQMLTKKLPLTKNKLEENYLITGGAAAGLSAAFSAPLSGIIFALEEVHRSFSPNLLIAATTASLTADVISNFIFGLKPELYFFPISSLPLHYYFWLVPIGIAAGFLGSGINHSLLFFQTLLSRLPGWMRTIIALLIAFGFGMFLPEILGGGINLIEMSERVQISFAMLLLYIIAKILFTSTSFGSGIPGGIFMPILAIGAMSGGAIGLLATYTGMPSEYIPHFCICAMAGALAGSVKAPVTAIVLIAEMTGSLVHTLPVAFVAFLALLVSDLLKTEPIYESLLERILHVKKAEPKVYKSGSIIEIPVEIGSIVAGKRVMDIEWPEGALVVAIHRGQKELVPKGNSKLHAGDFILVFSAEQHYHEMNAALKILCQAQEI